MLSSFDGTTVFASAKTHTFYLYDASRWYDFVNEISEETLYAFASVFSSVEAFIEEADWNQVEQLEPANRIVGGVQVECDLASLLRIQQIGNPTPLDQLPARFRVDSELFSDYREFLRKVHHDQELRAHEAKGERLSSGDIKVCFAEIKNKQPMLSRNFIAFASLLSSLVFQVDAGSLLPKAVIGDFTASFGPRVIAGDFEVQSSATPSRISPIGTSAHSIAPWAPLDENIVFNAPVPQDEFAEVGWFFDGHGAEDGTIVFDGWAKNITVYYTPPSGIEEWVFSLWADASVGLCGIKNGLRVVIPLDSTELGTYNARWHIEFGQSTQPDEPLDEFSGCGPLPFDSTTVEFQRSWEVIAAE
ncbi:hypothetical protein C8J57DRAFT_1219629 [Mycena rebaudengoi]|nr:hypothetical protein C8J57DRAFT_1219629 [Mycena rebaudengoi]